MGAGASTAVETLKGTSDADLASAVETLGAEEKAKLLKALGSPLPENGHHVIQSKIDASKPKWAELNAKGTKPPEGMGFPVALVADQDEASAGEGGWCSFLRYGKLVYHGDKGDASYSIDLPGEQPLRTKRGDKAGRGAEYSALEVFNDRLITMDDRTGNIDEIVPGNGFAFAVQPLENKDGPMALRMGDGKKDKPLKAEWSTQKGGKCIVGSTGKERTDDDGNVVHEGEMWVKSIDPATMEIEHLDWRPMYNMLRAASVTPQGAGYMIHESGRWSDEHQMWFFLPRKHSREPYDEIKDTKKCNNLMMGCPDSATPDGSTVVMQSYLDSTSSDLRGCSDFLFVPGTKDTHLFLLRTEETQEGLVSTYASVIDLEAKCLMKEMLVASERKFEGMAWVGGWNPFPVAGPSESLVMTSTAAVMKEPTPQSAFVFIKPHANTEGMQKLVRDKFAEVGIEILSEGEYDGKTIDEKLYIDYHYYAIASKATIMDPKDLPVPKAKFQEVFNVDWDEMVAAGNVKKATDAATYLEATPEDMDKLWGEAKKSKDPIRLVKFGGGFYGGKVIKGDKEVYTCNAFFMAMRSKFTNPEAKIKYFAVKFDGAKLSWADFRGKVLGPTDPATAPPDSLRGKLMTDWEKLGLKAPPNTGDNGVHASASPFEGLAEKMNWLSLKPEEDDFGKAIIEAGVTPEYMEKFKNDPQVMLPGGGGKKGSLFDQLEDMDFPDAVAKIKAIVEAENAAKA